MYLHHWNWFLCFLNEYENILDIYKLNISFNTPYLIYYWIIEKNNSFFFFFSNGIGWKKKYVNLISSNGDR